MYTALNVDVIKHIIREMEAQEKSEQEAHEKKERKWYEENEELISEIRRYKSSLDEDGILNLEHEDLVAYNIVTEDTSWFRKKKESKTLAFYKTMENLKEYLREAFPAIPITNDEGLYYKYSIKQRCSDDFLQCFRCRLAKGQGVLNVYVDYYALPPLFIYEFCKELEILNTIEKLGEPLHVDMDFINKIKDFLPGE